MAVFCGSCFGSGDCSSGHEVAQNAGLELVTWECGVRNAECGVRSAECGMRNGECGLRNVQGRGPRKFFPWTVFVQPGFVGLGKKERVGYEDGTVGVGIGSGIASGVAATWGVAGCACGVVVCADAPDCESGDGLAGCAAGSSGARLAAAYASRGAGVMGMSAAPAGSDLRRAPRVEVGPIGEPKREEARGGTASGRVRGDSGGDDAAGAMCVAGRRGQKRFRPESFWP